MDNESQNENAFGPNEKLIDQSHYETSYGCWDQVDNEPSDVYVDRSQVYFDLPAGESQSVPGEVKR